MILNVLTKFTFYREIKIAICNTLAFSMMFICISWDLNLWEHSIYRVSHHGIVKDWHSTFVDPSPSLMDMFLYDSCDLPYKCTVVDKIL